MPANIHRLAILICASGLLLWITLFSFAAGQPDLPPVSLRLQAGTFDPLSEPLPVPSLLAALESTTTHYAIVQFSAPIQPAWRVELETAGAQILDYIPDYAYLVRLPDRETKAMKSISNMRWMGDWLPIYRLSPSLWNAAGPLTLTVQFFPGESAAPAIQLPGALVLDNAQTHWQTTLRMQIDATELPTLAALPGIRWIEPAIPAQLTNDVAADLTGVSTIWGSLHLTGSGQIIAVADTGLDVGTSGTITDFAVLSAHCVGRPAPCQWDDPQGHGTHVAGSAVGNGQLSGGQFKGFAYGAALVIQSLYSPTCSGGLYIPADLNLLLAPAYADGARIHNNSWGSPGNRYDTWAQTIDQFVWDHPDMLVVAAAGNGGIDRGADGLVDPGSIYSPATAKNVLAVGAAESLRIGEGYTGTYGGADGASFPANPVRDDLISDAPWGLAAFSSHGPAQDGRTHPDLIIPGTNIISARSHHPTAPYAHVYDKDYAFQSGTSQAAPLASGAAALVRQYYATLGYTTPSAALMHATLVHGAVDIAPGQYGSAVSGTIVVSDNAEGTGIWTGTLGGWTTTSLYGSTSTPNAWVARGVELGFQRLDATINLSQTAGPLLTFWNYRHLTGSTVRVFACGSQRVVYHASDGGYTGWALDAVDIGNCAGNPSALIRFEFQCTAGCSPASADVWALDDIAIADGAHLAEIGPAPDPGQGWGRLDLTQLLSWPSPSTRWWDDLSHELQTGDAFSYTLLIVTDTVPLRVTLAWSDYPANPAAASALVNDLDMSLYTPEGKTIWPNRLSGPDRLNNIEQAELYAPPPGIYTIVITAHHVPMGPQAYALVVTSGGVRDRLVHLAKSVTPTAHVVLGETITYTITLSNDSIYADPDVTLVDLLPEGVSFGGWIEQDGAVRTDAGFRWEGEIGSMQTANLVFTASLTDAMTFLGKTMTNTAYLTASYGYTANQYAAFAVQKGYWLYMPAVLKSVGP